MRWLETFSYCLARIFLARSLRLEPFFVFENLLCNTFSLASDFSRYLGLAYTSPFEQTAKSFIPTSIPIDVSYLTAGFTGIYFPLSTRTEMKYLPVGVLLTVTEHTLPSNFLFGKNLTHPIFGSLTLLLSRLTDTEFIALYDCRL